MIYKLLNQIIFYICNGNSNEVSILQLSDFIENLRNFLSN